MNARDALVLRSIEGLGDRTFGRLIQEFESASEILSAGAGALREVEGISERLARRVAEARDGYGSWADQELERAARLGARVVGYGDPEYPERLRHLSDPPPALWIRGDPAALSDEGFAIVGSRGASAYGLEQGERFASALAALGQVISSGMARGVDTRAHEGALVAGGRTIAVLGSGLDVTYPSENRRLADRIASRGALVSEHPFGTPPVSGHFPRRNRILAALGWGVLVVEATARSGSLITAKIAAELGREVFAIPGRIDSPTSRGTNDLLKDAAHVVTDLSDIVQELPAFSHRPGPSTVELDEEERRIVDALGHGVRSFEELAREASLAAPAAAAVLTALSLKGVVKERPGNRFGLTVPVPAPVA